MIYEYLVWELEYLEMIGFFQALAVDSLAILPLDQGPVERQKMLSSSGISGVIVTHDQLPPLILSWDCMIGVHDRSALVASIRLGRTAMDTALLPVLIYILGLNLVN